MPRWRLSEGEDASYLSGAYGLTPDEWQSTVVDDVLAYRKDGRWVCTRYGLSVPRQNGKNGILEVVELYKIVVLNRKILHTAHEVKTARKAFLRLAGFFENQRKFPEMAARVKDIRRTNGQEAVLLHTAKCDTLAGSKCKCDGGSVEFIARSKGSGRGFTVDDLVCDEAQELDDFAYAALLPTISSAPSGNPQQIICGTPPGPRDNGEVFARLRKDVLSGKSPRGGWCEWSFDKGADPDDRTQWAHANPSLGIRLDVEVLEDERAAMDDAMFLRERGGMWDEAVTVKVIDDVTWAGLLDPQSQPSGLVSVSVDMSPEGATTSIGVAAERADGRWHVELIEHRSGSGWVVDRVAQVVERNATGPVVIDGASPAVALVEPLRARGVVVTVTGARGMGQACGSFYRLVMEDGVRHLGQPQVASSVSLARKRPIGTEGLWGWGRAISGADIGPVVALTLALHGAMSTTAEPQKRRRTGKAVFRG